MTRVYRLSDIQNNGVCPRYRGDQSSIIKTEIKIRARELELYVRVINWNQPSTRMSALDKGIVYSLTGTCSTALRYKIFGSKNKHGFLSRIQDNSKPLALIGPRGTTILKKKHVKNALLRQCHMSAMTKHQVHLESRAVGKVCFRALGVVQGPMSHCRAGSTNSQWTTVENPSTPVPVFGSFIAYLQTFMI